MLKYGTDLHHVLNSNQFSQHLVAFYYLLNRFLLVRFRQVEIIKIAPNIIFRAFPHSDTVSTDNHEIVEIALSWGISWLSDRQLGLFAALPGVAAFREYALTASWCFRHTTKRSKLHYCLVVDRRPGTSYQVIGKLAKQPSGFRFRDVVFHAKITCQYTEHIAVYYRHGLIEGNGCYSRGGIIADAGKQFELPE